MEISYLSTMEISYDTHSFDGTPPRWVVEIQRKLASLEGSAGALEAVDLLAQRVNVLEARIQVLMDLLSAKIK